MMSSIQAAILISPTRDLTKLLPAQQLASVVNHLTKYLTNLVAILLVEFAAQLTPLRCLFQHPLRSTR